jgi:hypothetical protein
LAIGFVSILLLLALARSVRNAAAAARCERW